MTARGLWRALMALAVGAATPAQAEVRGVFVGIDHYAYVGTATQISSSGIFNLSGAVHDARAMLATLNAVYHFGFDATVPATCPADPAATRSVLLLDQCATRAAIIAAIGAQIAAGHPGDTLILYFAGHGSTMDALDSDDPASQPTGADSTFLPYDARGPFPGRLTEILDTEFGEAIDIAKARGVSVVMIADYCNAATGARGEGDADVARGVHAAYQTEPVRYHHGVFADAIRLARPGDPGAAAAATGQAATGTITVPRSVFLAASLESEQAFEAPLNAGGYGGAFTEALTGAITANPGASFVDLLAVARDRVIDGGHRRQHPQGEGDLVSGLTGSGLGPAPGGAHPLDVARDAGSGAFVLPHDGALTDITRGSRLALYATASAALADPESPLARDRLATATVVAVEPYRARLALDRSSAGRSLPAQLYAREIRHVLARPPLRVELDAGFDFPELAGDRIDALDAIRRVRGVTVGTPGELELVWFHGGDHVLMDRANGIVAILGQASDRDYAAHMRTALEAQMQVDALLALARSNRGGGPLLCVTTEQIRPSSCGADTVRSRTAVLRDLTAYVTVGNTAAYPRYVTVLAIDERNRVAVVLPRRGGHDIPLLPQAMTQLAITVPGRANLCRYLAFATAQPFDADAWVQSGSEPLARSPGDPDFATECGGSLERSASVAASGAGDSARAASTDWSVTRINVRMH